MADFVQMMKDWRRMCIAANDVPGTTKCDNCPMDESRLCNFEVSDISDYELQDAETRITTWAAEHPEPVYPRWCDWLAEQGVLVCDNSFPNMRYWYAINKEKIEQPIPAGIAEKLGIEPKEAR